MKTNGAASTWKKKVTKVNNKVAKVFIVSDVETFKNYSLMIAKKKKEFQI